MANLLFREYNIFILLTFKILLFHKFICILIDFPYISVSILPLNLLSITQMYSTV